MNEARERIGRPPGVRQFLALELPDQERRRVESLVGRLARPDDGWRWVRAGGHHLTLRFLGSVDTPRDDVARLRWAEAARDGHPLNLALGEVGSFGAPRRPRVLWIGVLGGAALDRLAARVEAAAIAAGFAAEPRGFRPHVTLARARRGARPRLPAVPGSARREFRVDSLTLFRSDLDPRGARYTVLDRYPLGPR